MPILGVSSIYMYPKSVVKTIEDAAMMGFRHINIFAFPPHFKEDSDEFIVKVRKKLFEYGLDCSIKIQGYTINLAATNPNLRRKSIEEVNYWIDVASKLDCSAIIMRAGMFFYTERVFKEKTYNELITTLQDITERTESQGIEVCIENYPYPFDIIALPSDLIRLSKSLKGRTYLALNISHLYDIHRNRRIDVFSDLKTALPWVKVVYISEYVNPWDYPHKPDKQHWESYIEFLRRSFQIIRGGELNIAIIVGYSKDDVLNAKNFITQYLFF